MKTFIKILFIALIPLICFSQKPDQLYPALDANGIAVPGVTIKSQLDGTWTDAVIDTSYCVGDDRVIAWKDIYSGSTFFLENIPGGCVDDDPIIFTDSPFLLIDSIDFNGDGAIDYRIRLDSTYLCNYIQNNCSPPPPLESDLAISEVASPTEGLPGDVIQFSVTLENLGVDDDTNVSSVFVLPAEYINITPLIFSSGSTTIVGNTLTWDIPNMVVGTQNLVYTAQIDPTTLQGTGSPFPISNSVSVNGDNTDPNLANNTTSTSVDLQPGFMSCQFLHTNPATGNDAIDFDIVNGIGMVGTSYGNYFLGNSSPNNACTVATVNIVAAVGCTYVTTPTPLPQNLPGVEVDITPTATSWYITVVETCSDGITNCTYDIYGTATPPPLQSDLAISEVASPIEGLPGDVIQFSVTLQNLGVDDDTNVSADFVLPAEFINITPLIFSTGGTTIVGNTLTWYIPNLVVGTQNLVYTAQIDPTTLQGTGSPFPISNSVSVSGDNTDPNLANNSTSTSVDLQPGFMSCQFLHTNATTGNDGIDFDLVNGVGTIGVPYGNYFLGNSSPNNACTVATVNIVAAVGCTYVTTPTPLPQNLPGVEVDITPTTSTWYITVEETCSDGITKCTYDIFGTAASPLLDVCFDFGRIEQDPGYGDPQNSNSIFQSITINGTSYNIGITYLDGTAQPIPSAEVAIETAVINALSTELPTYTINTVDWRFNAQGSGLANGGSMIEIDVTGQNSVTIVIAVSNNGMLANASDFGC